MKQEKHIERRDKILAGLELAYERMLAFKRYKNSEVVVAQDGKVVRLKP